MGNTASAHHKVTGGATEADQGNKNGVKESTEPTATDNSKEHTSPKSTTLQQKQHRKRSSIFGGLGGGGGGGGNGGGNEPEKEEVLVRPEPLTDKQKEMLKDTWKELEDNIAKVGVITFISLFETHPDVQQVFMPFSGIELEDLKHSKQLRAHALRVMAFVQKAVARLHEPEKLESLLHDLGKKHFFYGAKQKYVDLIGPQFIQAIQPSLEDRWSPELHEAWTQLFRYMAFVMKTAMREEEKKNKAQQ